MRAWCCPICLLLAACPADDDVREVPLSVRLREAAPVGLDLQVVRAAWDIRAVRLRPCPVDDVVLDWPGVPEEAATLPGLGAPQPWSVGFDEPLRLVAGRTGIPLGPWCHLDLVVSGPLGVEAVTASGARLSLELDVPDLGMPFDVEFGAVELILETVGDVERTRAGVVPLLLELGTSTWLAAVVPALESGEDVVVTPDDPLHDSLVAGLVVGAALYRDQDFDGVLSERDRAGGRILGLVPVGG